MEREAPSGGACQECAVSSPLLAGHHMQVALLLRLLPEAKKASQGGHDWRGIQALQLGVLSLPAGGCLIGFIAAFPVPDRKCMRRSDR